MADTINNIQINSNTASKLITAHDGDCALVFIWSMINKNPDHEKAALDLCLTRMQTDAAFEKLERMGLLCTHSNNQASSHAPTHISTMPAVSETKIPLAPSDEIPDYSREEITSVLKSDEGFAAIKDTAQEVLGKELSISDLRVLLGIHKHLSLPAEVVIILLNYMADVSAASNGAIRHPTPYSIQREAYFWVHNGITTMEAAEKHADSQIKLHSSTGRIKSILEIRDRNLTAKETEYISCWLNYGFTEDAIALAYEKMINAIGKRQFPYMNTILTRWHEAGLHDAAAITANEEHTSSKSKSDSNKPRFIPTEF